MVPYDYEVGAVTLMGVVLVVSMLRECEGDGNTGVRDGGGVVVVSEGHGYVGDTRGSGIVSSAADVLWMSVLRGIREVGGVCEMCLAGVVSG